MRPVSMAVKAGKGERDEIFAFPILARAEKRREGRKREHANFSLFLSFQARV